MPSLEFWEALLAYLEHDVGVRYGRWICRECKVSSPEHHPECAVGRLIEATKVEIETTEKEASIDWSGML